MAMYPYLRKALLHLMKRLEEGKRGAQGARRGEGVSNPGIASALSSSVGGSGPASPGGLASWLKGEAAHGNDGAAAAGILGGSRWLSFVLDDEVDAPPEGGGLELYSRGRVQGSGPATEDDAGKGAGAVPDQNGSGSRVGSLVRRRGGLGARNGGAGSGADGGSGRGGSGSDDEEELLEALKPLRDVFLARSLERLTTPVEQMFPQVTGGGGLSRFPSLRSRFLTSLPSYTSWAS